MTHSRGIFVVLVVALAFGLTGCALLSQWFNLPSAGVPWANGDSVPVGSQTVPSSGGTVTVNDSGGPLAGMTIEVPAGAYAGSKTFTTSYKLITGDPGVNISPITPLITVENGGEFASDPMMVTIPVAVPAGHFAMGFFVTDTGQFEGMPLVAETSTSITVATAHFSRFIIASVPKALLTGTIDTGFRPMVDDWQFPNMGSYIASGGHCAGQAITAMWYYTEKTLNGTSTLYGRFDDNGNAATPDLWQDDSLGYRFASTIQKDIDWGNWSLKINRILNDNDDSLNWNAFLYSMLVTGEPQYVSLHSSTFRGGHAMIVYKADVSSGTLYVADPNYPGNTGRRIEYANGAFSPYNSGANKADIDAGKGRAYDKIGYLAKSALIPWDKVAARWREFEYATIGDDLFPSYTLVVKDATGADVPLVDGMTVSSDKLEIELDDVAFGDDLGFIVRRGNEWLSFDSEGKIDLLDGDNRLGLFVVGQKNGHWEYVDFKWVTVTKGSATTGYADITVQVHGNITTIHPHEINQETGQPGVTYHSDTPFEWIAFRSWDNGALAGNTFTASWSGFMELSQGPYTGSMTVVFNDAMDRVVSFTVTEAQPFDNGDVHTWSASGGDIPIEQIGNGFRWFVIEGTATGSSLSSFTDNWSYGNGQTMQVTSYFCDVDSYIEIYLYDKRPY